MPQQTAEALNTRYQGTSERASAIDQGDPLARLAAELSELSPEDRQRLAALLIGHQCQHKGE